MGGVRRRRAPLSSIVCGRYALKAMPAELAAHFDLAAAAEFSPRYNIAPGGDIPVIRWSPEGARVLHLLRWGLVPHWSGDPAIGAKLTNARAETVAEKPSFRDAFRRRRCLVPASGFYEWRAEGRRKQPYYISLRSGAPLALGGLWESWKSPDGSLLRTACLITTTPNAVMTPIHDRMPVILAPEHWQTWLSGPAEAAGALLSPYRDDELQAWPVSARVNRTQDDDEELTAPC